MQRGPDMGWLPQLVVLKDGEVVDNVLLHGKEAFVLGRHQNCDIVAGHASVSRHHLEIRVLHDSRELVLTDLKSVHGTKINGTKVNCLEPVVMKEDDKVQIGASTRSYMVKWMAVTPEASDSSSSSFTPARSAERSVMKGFDEEFQSSLRIGSSAEFDNQENKCNQNWTPRPSRSPANSMKTQPDSARRLAFSDMSGRSPSLSATKPTRMSVHRSSPMSRRSTISESPKPREVLGDLSARKSDLVTRSPSPATNNRALPAATKSAVPMSPGGKKVLGERSNLQMLERTPDQTPSKLWLRRCHSNPLPAIKTKSKAQSPLAKVPACKEDADDVLSQLSQLSAPNDDEDEYPSDKENMAPVVPAAYPKSAKSALAPKLFSSEVERQPFRELFCLPSPKPPEESPSFGEPAQLGGSMFGPENIFRAQKHTDASDLRKQWHIVVDADCFMDEASFKSLKQLEGIKETRLIIPKIVIRELDYLKRRNKKESQARTALRWIESCMIKMPWWIHVQNSYETRPVGATPPVSPSFLAKDFSQFGSVMDLLSPTNDDHVLDCALLFDRSILDGRVVLLTNDTALKIKAMAEGLVSQDATSFCESLLSPYSDRFLWSGSTAHGVRTPRSRSGTPDRLLPLACSSRVKPHPPTGDEELPRGLQLVLQS